MKTYYKLVLAIVASFGLYVAAIEDLHAQAKAPLYVVTEIDVKNLDAYVKEYAPKAQALIKKSGGRIVAVGQNVTSVEGRKPAPRVSIQVWESMDQYKAYRGSAEFKEVRKIGNKYAKFRSFTIEGLPQ